MYKIYKCDYQFLWGKEWTSTSFTTHYIVSEDPPKKEKYIHCETFSNLVKLTETFHGVNLNHTLFKHKEQVEIYLTSAFSSLTITQKKFKPLNFKIVYSDFIPTYNWCKEHLSLEDFKKIMESYQIKY